MKQYLIYFSLIVVTAIVTDIISNKLRKKREESQADFCLDLLGLLFESCEDNKVSGVDYVIKKRGKKHAIYVFGTVYMLLKKKDQNDENVKKLSAAIEGFLAEELKDDIAEYKNSKKEGKK